MTGKPVPYEGWRWLGFAAAVLGLFAVLLGAVGSHAVELPDAAAQRSWSVALQIHYFQSAALLALAALEASARLRRSILVPAFLQVIGTLVFCGNLYLRATGRLWFPSMLTPAGGMLLILSWAGVCVQLLRKG